MMAGSAIAILLCKRIALVLIILGGVVWLIAGIKTLENPHQDVLPWVVSGFIVTISGVLFAQLDDKP